jgi:serine/threonine-protein kinase
MADLRTHRELTERGEAAIVSALLPLGDDYVILPHLLLPGLLGSRNPDDLDLLVIGPQGAALLEYRHWHGRLTVAPAGKAWVLRFTGGGSESRPNPAESLRRKAEALGEHLAASGLTPPKLVTAVVVPDRTELLGDAGVTVLPASRCAAWVKEELAGESTPWTRSTADLLRPPTPPRMVNQYRLSSLLSRRGDHASYLAYDTRQNRLVTLHELPYDPFQRPEDLERNRTELLREAKLTLDLHHPAIARTEQLIPQDDCYYVVAEWIDGAQSLREVESQGEMAMEAALDVAIACADALAYAHARGIVHRDVRPENILIAGRTVKLTGFKMAKKADLATRSTFDLRQMAQENPYAAPEFRLGAEGPHRVDVRADVYALGAVLYEALTGKPPMHLDEKYWEPPSAVNFSVPLALNDVIQQALRFDPVQRFSTMAAFRERMLAVREGRPGEPTRARYVDRKLVKRTRNSLLYRATDVEASREVALKKVLIDPMLPPEDRKAASQRLLREAQIAHALVHPRIVTVLDRFVEDDDPYLVMEWLDGHDLREHLDGKRAALSVDEALDLVKQVGEALSYAHEQGVVHRDIKPENLFLVGRQPMILDFGLASMGPDEGSSDDRAAGTPRYMAPEFLRGGPLDARADLFSLAVVLYELLTERYPYPANLIMSRYQADLADGVAPPSHLNLAVPPALDAPLLKALSLAPEDRPQTMADFLQILAHAQDEREPGGLLPTGEVPWKAFALGGALTLVLAGGAAFIYLGGPTLWGGAHLPSLEASATPGAVDVAIASPSLAPATPTPLPTTSPTPEPTPTVAPTTPPVAVSWASAPVSHDALTVQVERIEPREAGDTLLTLKVTNAGTESVALVGSDPAALSVADDRGTDYTAAIDWSSVSAALGRIEPNETVEGTVRVSRPIDREAGLVKVLLKESGGANREFSLRAYRLEGK